MLAADFGASLSTLNTKFFHCSKFPTLSIDEYLISYCPAGNFCLLLYSFTLACAPPSTQMILATPDKLSCADRTNSASGLTKKSWPFEKVLPIQLALDFG